MTTAFVLSGGGSRGDFQCDGRIFQDQRALHVLQAMEAGGKQEMSLFQCAALYEHLQDLIGMDHSRPALFTTFYSRTSLDGAKSGSRQLSGTSRPNLQ